MPIVHNTTKASSIYAFKIIYLADKLIITDSIKVIQFYKSNNQPNLQETEITKKIRFRLV